MSDLTGLQHLSCRETYLFNKLTPVMPGGVTWDTLVPSCVSGVSACSHLDKYSQMSSNCFFFGWPCFRFHPPWVSSCCSPDPASLQHMSRYLRSSGSRHQVSGGGQAEGGQAERGGSRPRELQTSFTKMVIEGSSLRFKQTKLQRRPVFSLLKFVF